MGLQTLFIKTKRSSIKMQRSSSNKSHLCRAMTILLLLSGSVRSFYTISKSRPTPSCSGVTDNFVKYGSGENARGFYVEVDTRPCGDGSYDLGILDYADNVSYLYPERVCESEPVHVEKCEVAFDVVNNQHALRLIYFGNVRSI